MAKQHEEIPDEPSPARIQQMKQEYGVLRHLIDAADSEVNRAKQALADEDKKLAMRAEDLDDREQELVKLKTEADEARAAAAVAKKTLAAKEKEFRELEAYVTRERKVLDEKAAAHSDEVAAVKRERDAIEKEKKALAEERLLLDRRAADLAGTEADHAVRRKR